MANAAFGEAVPTDGRNPERVADSILARLAITRRAATVADRAFACRTHHLAYRDVVERKFGALRSFSVCSVIAMFGPPSATANCRNRVLRAALERAVPR